MPLRAAHRDKHPVLFTNLPRTRAGETVYRRHRVVWYRWQVIRQFHPLAATTHVVGHGIARDLVQPSTGVIDITKALSLAKSFHEDVLQQILRCRVIFNVLDQPAAQLPLVSMPRAIRQGSSCTPAMIHVAVWLTPLTRRCLGLAAGAPFGVEFGDKFHVSMIVSTMSSHGCSYRYKLSDCLRAGGGASGRFWGSTDVPHRRWVAVDDRSWSSAVLQVVVFGRWANGTYAGHRFTTDSSSSNQAI